MTNLPKKGNIISESTANSEKEIILLSVCGFIFIITENIIYMIARRNPILDTGIIPSITPNDVDMHFPPLKLLNIPSA